MSPRILRIGFEPQGRRHLFTLSKAHSVMSFCALLKVVHRWVAIDDVKRENVPRSFRSGLELLNLNILICSSNQFHSNPVTAFANIFEQVFNPTNARHTHTYGSGTCVSTSCYTRKPKSCQPSAQGSRARVSLLSHILLLAFAAGTICSVHFQIAVSRIEKSWESVSRTPGIPCTLRLDCSIRTGLRLCPEAPHLLAHNRSQMADLLRLPHQLEMDFEASS